MFDVNLDKFRIVDLSYEVALGQTGERPFVGKRGLLADGAYKYDIVDTHSHVGTHVEFPAHFFDGGKDGTDYPLTAFMGRGVLLPITCTEHSLAIRPDVLEQTIGDILREGDIVVARNEGPHSEVQAQWPYFTPEAGGWLRDREIKMLVLGLELQLGKDIPDTRAFHDILMGSDVTFVEFPDHLDQLTKRTFFFMALPFKVKGLDGSWARAIAIEER
ncbi:MAG: cyclase family protein [Candidatus Latescibacteria bacterium]|nr:cyclase family protein [Candidatus Latescibacterota bacterium]